MSNINLIIEERAADIGKFMVGRLLYILEGGIESGGNVYGPKQILVAKDSTLCEFTIQASSILYIFGGEPFVEERFIDWNFVSSRKERIEEAKQRWMDQTFDKIKGDEIEFVPYPIRVKK